MTLNEFQQILKSRQFKSKVNGSDDSYVFTFTEIYIYRDGKPLCIYELIQENVSFKFVFTHLFQNVYTDNFKNVMIVIDNDNRFPIIVNTNSLSSEFNNGIDITFIAQNEIIN